MTDIKTKVEQQDKRAGMVRERDALNFLIAGGPKPRDGSLGFHPGVIANARAESRRLTEALGKMPPNAGRAFRRASRVRAPRVKPAYPLAACARSQRERSTHGPSGPPLDAHQERADPVQHRARGPQRH